MYRKLVNNAVFICNESLFFVSAASTSAFQLEHTPQLLYAAYAPGTIKYGLSNMGKYWSCWSMGNIMGAYMRYIINADYCIIRHAQLSIHGVRMCALDV